MAHLMLKIFVIELIVSIVNAIGAKKINDLVGFASMQDNVSLLLTSIALDVDQLSSHTDFEIGRPAARGPGRLPQGPKRTQRNEQPGPVCEMGKATPTT